MLIAIALTVLQAASLLPAVAGFAVPREADAAQRPAGPQRQQPLLAGAIGALWPSKPGAYDSAVNCGSDGDVLTLHRFELSPDPPVRGSPLEVLLNGTLSEDVVEGAVAQVTVKLGFIQIIDRPYDLCEQATAVDLECPIAKGPVLVKKAFDIPRELPPGRYRVNVDVRNADDKHVGCLSADFRM
ncbi:Phosphatidylglycerol/phosphatidylinositol transfer protein [Polyrhizophydium stewartii]|uniref:Phosphatidylglycerol/phosphatidylinositol transfer protein n=1 Tax=Polyrhizophydium stewartii TaxID=2732419 RepID=A0ABR4NB92_9FUNG|nr:Phosphatidylglycerol/phosphatidylinositol transfer protein [Polyrhizophydium stewartii]